MPHRHHEHHPVRGFVLPLALVLVLVVASLSVSALDDVATQRAIAGARLSQQRAFLAASAGLELILDQPSGLDAASGTRIFALPATTDTSSVDWRRVREHTLPAGFSAGHFVERTAEVRSTGNSFHGARATQMQSVSRVEPVAASASAAP